MLDFFNNASVGAFIGAFSAFFLVAASDLRRRYRYKRLLTYLIADSQDLARKKLETVHGLRALLQNEGKIIPSPVMKFPVHSIRDYQFQVLDILNANQKQGLDALAFWMDAVDELLGESVTTANLVIKAIKAKDTATESLKVTEYGSLLEEAENNLSAYVELSGYYVSGEPHRILEWYGNYQENGNT